ncbi:hypothetical protein RQP46_001782 [Phenoliferia psychrophenolica]
MHFATLVPALAVVASASPLRRDAAIRDSPSGTYAPTTAACPLTGGPVIRQGPTVDPLEAAYIQAKTVTSLDDWTAYLNGVGLEGLDVSIFVPSADKAVAGKTMPILSFAVSGGGQRAMLVGGGILAAFDNRNATAVAAKSGGVLQLAQYAAGLSGGSWCLGSWSLAGFPSFEGMRDEVWNMTQNYFTPPSNDATQDADAAASIALKQAAGAPVSVIDAYGRILAYHLVNDSRPATDVTSGPGAATLWSSIKDTPLFKAKSAPFTIIISTARVLGNIYDGIANPIYESTPYHFGTNLPSSGGLFVPIEYLGTKFESGKPSTPICMKGFDNAGFLMGCSGNIFGAPIQLAEGAINVSAISNSVEINKALGQVPDEKLDNGRVVNPFLGLSAATGFPATSDAELALLDGGLGTENVPFWPLMQPEREIDVIIAIDGSADTNNYPDGQEIYHTYQKSLQPGYGRTPFPVGLNLHPVFFGSDCIAQPNNVSTPLILYLPNYFVNYPTNTSTGANSYTDAQTHGFFANGLGIATQNGSKTWPKCMACALIDAQQVRNGDSRSPECSACFEQYCYKNTM